MFKLIIKARIFYLFPVAIAFVCVMDSAWAVQSMKNHQQNAMPMHGMHGMHGMIIKGSEKFPTTAYNETKLVRPVESPALPSMKGDPVKGKALAFAKSKGRCLTCHVLGPDGVQAGNVGPNLSGYANLKHDDRYTFQQIWDARTHNLNTLMPPFGTNGLLTRHEVLDILAYLNTLKTPLNPTILPTPSGQNFDIAGEDFTLADIYIEKGEALFNKPAKNGKSCASCHTANSGLASDLKGAASTYPKYNTELKRVIDVEQRINICQKKYKHSPPYRLGGKPSNLLTSYVKYLSRRVPIHVSTQGPAAAAIQRGKSIFRKKAGQLNFACADCHATAAGKWLRGQPLRDITPNGRYSNTAATWPRHFIAGHDLGLISLRQRIRHCQIVTRTYPLKLNSPEYGDLELYLTALANGKPMLAPTKSRFGDGE